MTFLNDLRVTESITSRSKVVETFMVIALTSSIGTLKDYDVCSGALAATKLDWLGGATWASYFLL